VTQRLRVFLSILRGSLFERRGRVALAVAAIAIGTSVAAALLLVSRDVGSKVRTELRVYGPNAMLAPAHAGSGSEYGNGARRWLEGERAAGRVSAFATLRYGSGRVGDRAFALAGADLDGLLALYPAWRASGPAGGAIFGAELARALGIRPGADVTILVAHGAGTTPLPLRQVRVVSTGGGEDQVAYVDRVRLAEATGQDPARFQLALARVEGTSAQVLAWAEQPAPPAIWSEDHAQTSLRAIKQLSAADGEVLTRLSRLLFTVTAVALLAAILCAMSTLADLVLERTREVALLRSLGAGRRDVLALFASEAVAIGLAGGAVGLTIGIVAAQAIGRGVFGTGIAFAPVALPVTLGLGVATALLASLFPVRHALAIEPAPILRGE
jgi:putative ABC transport system permease protein